MKVSASMESLWQYIQSLSLSERNREWLADKLLEGTRKKGEEETERIGKEEILAGINAGLKEMKNGQTRPARELLKELQNGL